MPHRGVWLDAFAHSKLLMNKGSLRAHARRQRLCGLRQAPHPNAYDIGHGTRHGSIRDTIRIHAQAMIGSIPTDTPEDGVPVIK